MLARNIKPIPPITYVKTFGLWLVTAVLAFFEILVVREIVFNLYARIIAVVNDGVVRSADYFTATALGQITTYVMVVVAIAVVIGGFEYQWWHVGQRRSQKVLLWTLGLQLAVLLVYLFI